MASRLGLGTAQFGFDYGIANANGQVPEPEASHILEVARQAGISALDTAPAYGSAESTLGRLLRQEDRFRIITKTVALSSPTITQAEVDMVQSKFDTSLRSLGVEKVAGVLVHQADDLLKPGGARLVERLETWKVQGKVDKIGVSVYDGQQIDRIFGRYPFDLVQLPLNVFDQRLIHDGTLVSLAKAKVEIHARSIFLQGLMLMEEEKLPRFAWPWRERIRLFQDDLAQTGVSVLDAALSFVRQLPTVGIALVGVLSAEQLQCCLAAEARPVVLDWPRYAIDDPRLVDPRNWPPRR